MFENRKNRIFTLLENIFLYLMVVFFCIFSSLPVNFFSIFSFFPNITLMLIFYLFIIKKENIPYFSIFLFGIFYDVFNNLPLGSTSFVWLIISRIMVFLRQHFYTPDIPIFILRDFIIFSFLNYFIQWFLFCIIYKILYPVYNSLIQFVLDIAIFSIILFFLDKIKVKK